MLAGTRRLPPGGRQIVGVAVFDAFAVGIAGTVWAGAGAVTAAGVALALTAVATGVITFRRGHVIFGDEHHATRPLGVAVVAADLVVPLVAGMWVGWRTGSSGNGAAVFLLGCFGLFLISLAHLLRARARHPWLDPAGERPGEDEDDDVYWGPEPEREDTGPGGGA